MFAQSRAEWAEVGFGEMLSTDKDGALHHRRLKFPYVGNTGSQQAGASAWTAISLSHHTFHHPKVVPRDAPRCCRPPVGRRGLLTVS